MTAQSKLPLARLLQLASPALPVGAYSYSQGLESAVEAGIIRNAASASRWIGEVLDRSIMSLEAPLLVRLVRAFATGDATAYAEWNELFVASRETAELRAETLQMGHSLNNLLDSLGVPTKEMMPAECGYPAAYARAVAAWGIDEDEAVMAYVWLWLENQVMAALKSVPLGQTDGQRMLLDLAGHIDAGISHVKNMEDDDMGSSVPHLAVLSAVHETQYSRLFRS